MTAMTNLPERPLGDTDDPLFGAVEGQTPPPSSSNAVGPQNHQYRRLFGLIPADRVMVSVVAQSSPGTADNSGSPPALCDPTQAESHPLYQLLAEFGHPSALSLAGIAALRARHMTNGHTPEADAAHGPLFFKHKADEAYRAALAARSPETRRKRLITAAAIIIAQIDAEDFQTQQQEPPREGL